MFSNRTNWNLSDNRLSQALARRRANNQPFLDLMASNPTECGFTYDRHAIMRALCSPAALEYRPDPRGLTKAREAVCAYYAGRGLQISPQDLILTTSTSEAYSFIFRLLCDFHDDLLIPAPGYPLFDFLADIQDVKLKSYPLIYDHGWQIDMHALKGAIHERTRGVIVVHPNNPTGHFSKPDEQSALSQICADHRMAIIADEVFLDFSLTCSPQSFCGNRGALTFTMSGLSKISGLPQMKLAWIVVSGPEPLKRESLARLEVIADTYLSPSAPAQLAAPAFLELRHEFQKQLMIRVRTNLAELDRKLSQQKSCSRLEVEAGWYAILRVPATRSEEDLALELLEQTSVYVHPGHFYDFQQDGFLVVSLITPAADFSAGMERVLRHLNIDYATPAAY